MTMRVVAARPPRFPGGENAVRFRLVPRDEGFYPLFNEAAENVADCARRLRELLAEDFTVAASKNIEKKAKAVNDCESRGDDITRNILRRLHSSFVTPFDREDIHALTEELDDVVDEMQAAAELIVLHRVDKMLPQVKELGDTLVEAAETVTALIAKLPKLRGMDAELEAIDRLESAGDKAYRRAVAHLFSGEYKALMILKWKDIVEAVEGSLNAIENIGDIVESIALKHA
jgi:predicted phosphate transport protein (TIGR00153 family)